MQQVNKLFLAVLLMALFVGCAQQPPERIYAAPDSVRQVRLTGAFGGFGVGVRSVKAVVSRRGVGQSDLGTIYSFDFFDVPFDKAFEAYDWPDARVFRLAVDKRPPRDRLTVSNLTGERLPFVLCNANDYVMIFDLEPNERIDTRVSAADETDLLFMSARAKRSDGTTVSATRNIPGSRQSGTVNHYQLLIDHDGIKLAVYFDARP